MTGLRQLSAPLYKEAGIPIVAADNDRTLKGSLRRLFESPLTVLALNGLAALEVMCHGSAQLVIADPAYTNRPFARFSREKTMNVIGYIRVSTQEQADSRAGLEAQRTAIELECQRRQMSLACIIEDAGYSAKNLKRPGIQQAMAMLKAKQADGLVVAKLDRLSRSLLDFASLMDQARREGWSLVALDLGVDTYTPSGEMMASVLATFAQFERRLIGQRTKDALAVRRAQGVKLGRPRSLSDETVGHLVELRETGLTYREIAQRLNATGVPTGQGANAWHAATVHRVVKAARRGHE
jgi:DNA invertase Pin-like site-specific DNA recombinase